MPDINKKPFTKEEDNIIIEKYNELGPYWTKISQFLQNRPQNRIKNRFYSYINKKLAHKLKF